MGKEVIYALYEGDKFLDLGTSKELAKKFHVKPQTIRYYASRTTQQRAKENRKRLAIRIDDEEDDEDETG